MYMLRNEVVLCEKRGVLDLREKRGVLEKPTRFDLRAGGMPPHPPLEECALLISCLAVPKSFPPSKKILYETLSTLVLLFKIYMYMNNVYCKTINGGVHYS